MCCTLLIATSVCIRVAYGAQEAATLRARLSELEGELELRRGEVLSSTAKELAVREQLSAMESQLASKEVGGPLEGGGGARVGESALRVCSFVVRMRQQNMSRGLRR